MYVAHSYRNLVCMIGMHLHAARKPLPGYQIQYPCRYKTFERLSPGYIEEDIGEDIGEDACVLGGVTNHMHA